MADRNTEERYSIEARSLGVAGVASHNFLVLRDGDGRALAELHGLATDRKTGQGVAIGTDETLHSLRVWHFAHDAGYAKAIGVQADGSTFIADGQDHKTVLTAGKEEVMARWNAAVVAKEPLNALDLDYPNYGFKMSGDTVNSNAAYRTLSEIMGVPVHDFPGKLEPGLDNRMVDQKEIDRLRTHGYPTLDTPSVKTNGEYKPLEAPPPQPEPSPGPSPSAFGGSRAQDDRDAQYDARSPSHPGHADYARIREGLAGSVQDPQSLDSTAASAYREMVANPQMKQVDYVGVHNGNAVLAYAPHGLGREPMFTAHTDIAQAQQQPAEEHLGRAQAIVETRALAQAQEQSSQQQSQTQGGPAMSIGARTT
ncbi:MAG: XVIPCD domain-containing protein [Lysobacteraceae bacterium]